jgi:hypothetical protein
MTFRKHKLEPWSWYRVIDQRIHDRCVAKDSSFAFCDAANFITAIKTVASGEQSLADAITRYDSEMIQRGIREGQGCKSNPKSDAQLGITVSVSTLQGWGLRRLNHEAPIAI